MIGRHLRDVRWTLINFFAKRLTPAGRSLFIIWFIAALQGSVSLDIPIYHIWSFTTVCLATAWLSSFIAVPNLQLTRRHLQPVTAGTDLTYEVELRNLSQRAAYGLNVTEMELPAGMKVERDAPPSMVHRLAPQSNTVLSLRIHCSTRGHHTLPGLYAASSYPLGLCRGLAFHMQASQATVYPAYTIPETFHLPLNPSIATPNIGQATALLPTDESTDFAYIREYRHGDNPRHLHWASWARLGMPAVKVFQPEETGSQIGVVLDTAVRSPHETDALESGISAIAGIAAYLTRQSMSINFVMAENIVYRFSGDTPDMRFDHLMNTLADIQAGQPVDWTAVAARLFDQTFSCNTLVFVALDWSVATAAFVASLQDHGIGVRTLVIRQASTSQPLPVSTSAEDIVHLRPGKPWPQASGAEPLIPWNGP